MSHRGISLVFEEYTKARLNFLYEVSEFAYWESSIKYLEVSDLIDLLAPLTNEKVVKIRKRAVTLAAKLAEKSEVLALKMMSICQFTALLKEVHSPDIPMRKAVIQFAKGLARHSTTLASRVVKMEVVPDLVISLEDFDIEIKREAVSALGHISKHNENLSKTVIECGSLQLLISCYLQPDVVLQQNVMKVFEDLAQYHPKDLVTEGVLNHVVKATDSANAKLKKSALKTLALIGDFNEELAKSVVDAGGLRAAASTPSISSAFIIRNIAKHLTELAQKAVDAGACELLVQLLTIKEIALSSASSNTTVTTDSNQARISSPFQISMRKTNFIDQNNSMGDVLKKQISTASLVSKSSQQNVKQCLAPVIEALGFIAGHSPKLAMDVITAKAVVPLMKILCDSVRMNKGIPVTYWDSEHLTTICSCVWTLGRISQHSEEHSEHVAAAGTLVLLVKIWQNNNGTDEVQKQIEESFVLCLKHCTYRPALEPLLHLAPTKLLLPVLIQYSKILPHDAKARRLFVTTGALQKVQDLSKELGTNVEQLISSINACFPDEVLKYFSPNFVNTLLDHMDNLPLKLQESEAQNSTEKESHIDTATKETL